MSENVILVNEHDTKLGLMEKMEAHEKGLLHRAFSVFVLNNKNELLLQQRAFHKYHSGGLWTNTCCSHPRQGETNEQAAHRRLKEEMGFDCKLEHVLEFTYKAVLDKGMTEHEYDHVFVGHYNSNPHINPDEAQAFAWRNLGDINKDMEAQPEQYTEWFKIIFNRFTQQLNY